MGLESKVLEPEPIVGAYSPEDIIVVVDTSFLIALSNRHVWAYQSILMLESIANSRGAKWIWRAPLAVIEEYDRFFLEGTLEEETKIRLAPLSIDEILGSHRKMGFSFEHYTSELSRETCKDSPEGRKQARRRRPRDGGKADVKVIEFAIGIAQSGADVYVASSDFKDIIRPLANKAQFFADSCWRITPVYPSEIDLQYWKVLDQEITIKAALTGAAISDLQGIEESGSFYYAVVFEKNVQSGNATFDVGVGIAKKEYFKPFNLPEEYSSISGNYRLVPVVKVKSLQGEEGRKKVAQAFKGFNTSQLVVVEERQPPTPKLVTVSRYAKNVALPLYRADLYFLYWQANSEFAKSTYHPISIRR